MTKMTFWLVIQAAAFRVDGAALIRAHQGKCVFALWQAVPISAVVQTVSEALFFF